MTTTEHAIISSDIVSSTSLSVSDLSVLIEGVSGILADIARMYDGFWGRIVKGDTIECFVPAPKNALRIAVILKAFVKEFAKGLDTGANRLKRNGIRFSIGIGTMLSNNGPSGLLMGDAVNLAGRNLAGLTGKTSCDAVAECGDMTLSATLNGIANTVSLMVRECTPKQCAVVRRLCLGMTEDVVANQLGISQAAVSIRATGANWRQLKAQVELFENLTK